MELLNLHPTVAELGVQVYCQPFSLPLVSSVTTGNLFNLSEKSQFLQLPSENDTIPLLECKGDKVCQVVDYSVFYILNMFKK